MPYHTIKQKKPQRTQTEKFKHSMNVKIKRLETANKILKDGYKLKWSKKKGNWVKGKKRTSW